MRLHDDVRSDVMLIAAGYDEVKNFAEGLPGVRWWECIKYGLGLVLHGPHALVGVFYAAVTMREVNQRVYRGRVELVGKQKVAHGSRLGFGRRTQGVKQRQCHLSFAEVVACGFADARRRNNQKCRL